jgi:HAD superfamily hydrolase (TIGR01484 family)
MKKVIAFDLDGTLAASKSPLADRMSEVLNRLLDNFQVCVISGGKFEQFQKQLLSNLKASPEKLEKLHLMPTCGTRYYTYDLAKKDWEKVYSEDFTAAEKQRISQAIDQAIDDLGMREKETYGELIEDRDSQMAFSALGQDIIDVLGEEGLKRKENWDPTNEKKSKLRDYIAALIPEFEVRSGGLTTIDITKLGIDKAYGMKKLCELLEISKENILFFGDRLAEGGNDYPVKAMGIDSLEVSRWEDTALALEAILAVVED